MKGIAPHFTIRNPSVPINTTRTMQTLRNQKMPAVGKQRAQGGLYEEKLASNGVVLCVAVSTPRGNNMDDPTQKPGRTDPRKTSHH